MGTQIKYSMIFSKNYEQETDINKQEINLHICYSFEGILVQFLIVVISPKIYSYYMNISNRILYI